MVFFFKEKHIPNAYIIKNISTHRLKYLNKSPQKPVGIKPSFSDRAWYKNTKIIEKPINADLYFPIWTNSSLVNVSAIFIFLFSIFYPIRKVWCTCYWRGILWISGKALLSLPYRALIQGELSAYWAHRTILAGAGIEAGRNNLSSRWLMSSAQLS